MNRKAVLLLVSTAALFAGSWWAMQTVYASRHDTLLRVDVLDIGQGDAILITAPNRTRLLVDTGPNQQVLAALGAVLPSHVQELDAILLTHPDLDHIGGTVDVFGSFDVGMLLVSSTSKSNDITSAIDAYGVPKEILKRGDRIVLDSVHGVYADVLAPEAHWDSKDGNELSIVLKLVYGETCFILTGDASKRVEHAVAYAYKEFLDCDVLKVGHHGSNTSTSDAFVGHISPQYAVLSLGKDNEFGHPHAEVLETLARFNAEIHRTDLLGTISFISDGKTVSIDKGE